MIEVTIPAVPVAQPRCKATRVGGFTRVYTPKTADVFKATIAMSVQQVHKGSPLDGPLRVTIRFVFPRPASKVWKNRPMLREYKPTRPDLDNTAKAVLDALNKIL